MRTSRFTDADTRVLLELINQHKFETDRQLCARWVNIIHKPCSHPQFCRIVNNVSKRYKVQRKTLLKTATKEKRLKGMYLNYFTVTTDAVLHHGDSRFSTLYCDEKWFSQSHPTSVRCLCANDADRYNTQLPAARQQVKVMLFAGIAFGRPPLVVQCNAVVDRVEILRIVGNEVIKYMQTHRVQYLYWDNAAVHGTQTSMCLGCMVIVVVHYTQQKTPIRCKVH